MPETAGIVEKVQQFVRRKMHADGEAIRYNAHIIFVLEYARQLAVLLNADQEIAALGALLHDITKPDDPENHHLSGSQEAERILQTFDYPQEKIEKIKHCIEAHRRTRGPEPRTSEAVCVSNADRIAHIMFPLYSFYDFFTIKGKDFESAIERLKRKLMRNWESLIPEAKTIVKHQYQAPFEILESILLDEANKKAKS